MTEIAQLFESALKQNRATLLRRAAINTVARMPADTTLRELLASEASQAIRELTLQDLATALAGGEGATLASREVASDGAEPAKDKTRPNVWPESPEEKIYREILEAVCEKSLTIGQLSKQLDLDTEELRGYINWMKKMGKISSSGRARATRYFAEQ